jgi:hypothetical protein
MVSRCDGYGCIEVASRADRLKSSISNARATTRMRVSKYDCTERRENQNRRVKVIGGHCVSRYGNHSRTRTHARTLGRARAPDIELKTYLDGNPVNLLMSSSTIVFYDSFNAPVRCVKRTSSICTAYRSRYGKHTPIFRSAVTYLAPK